MTLATTHPALSDLARRARRRVPRFVWEFLDSGTGVDAAKARSRVALDQVLFRPAILEGAFDVDLTTTFLGRDYPLPFGIAPIGMSGLIWPNAECHLARLGATAGIPYCLSTVAAQTPETVGPLAGAQGWFQLYPPKDKGILKDLLKRAKTAGFHTLVLTADVPVASRRERQRRAGLQVPMKITPKHLYQAAIRPTWAVGTIRHGIPHLRTLESYADTARTHGVTEHIGYQLRAAPDWDDLAHLRDLWDGPLIVKGVLAGDQASRLITEGVDAIWVSNHGGRQFDGAPASLDGLHAVRAAAGDSFPLIYDGGIEGGLDIMRALAMGADFVMLGRAFHHGLAAFGARGAQHVVDILREDMMANMGQIGARRLRDLGARLLAG